MSKHTHQTSFQIGETAVLLKVAFNFIPYRRATGPTYACGGQPEEAAEVDIASLEWSRDNNRTRTYEWHKIDGPLFDIIAEDEGLYGELCDAANNDDIEAREYAAEMRAEFAREDRA